jgi:LPS-assembly protein
MLGYFTVSIVKMHPQTGRVKARAISSSRLFVTSTVLFVGFSMLFLSPAAAQQAQPAHSSHPRSAKAGQVEIWSSGPQQKRGDLFIADGNVDIHYGVERLRADHVEYNDDTSDAVARGHVLFDYENEHLEATEAHYNVTTGHGTFLNVRGTIEIERRANPLILVSDNPLTFQSPHVERFANDVYLLRSAWITVCDAKHPTWTFYASHARVRLNKTVALVSANFRLFRIPLVWLPYANAPAGEKIRQSGFLIPVPSETNNKGFILGDAFYWAPTPWFDTTLGADWLSKRGSSQRGEVRARPFQNTSIKYTYYGVIDRGLEIPIANGSQFLEKQGGHQQQAEVQSLLSHNWRFVADYNQLSSLEFRLAFADTFGEAISSEVRSATFLSNNFDGFSFNVAALSDKTFLSIPVVNTTTGSVTSPVTISFRTAPQASFSSVEQSPWQNVPIYFSFDSFVDALHRQDTSSIETLDTPHFVPRVEFAPKVTIPLRLGDWLGVTTSAIFRTTFYGDSYDSAGNLSGDSITRNTGELTVEVRPPTLERFFDRTSLKKDKPRKRYRHTIEPYFSYHYVDGVHNFADFIRFDADSTITDTSEIQYGITQRLFTKTGDDQPTELLTWSVYQAHYYDPTFGGAIQDGQRNVFASFEAISPFAFAFGPRNWSPVTSDFTITPGGLYDIEQILQYDPQIQRVVTIGTLLKVKPYKQFTATIADFRLDDNPVTSDFPPNPPSTFIPFQQVLSNQIRALIGYGDRTRKGFNVLTGVSYDFTNRVFQNQLVQLSYNGSCCGLALEYQRINLGQVRTENRFTATLNIANIGSAGNLRPLQTIF